MSVAICLIGPDAITETYQDVQKLICDTAWKFQRAHGGDFEEMTSIANLVFMKAFLSHDANRASFVTWFRLKMEKAFLEMQRGDCQRAHFNLPLEDRPTRPIRPFVELLSELSQDAQTIVELLLEFPDTLQEGILKKSPHPCHVRPVLKAYLKTFFGWSDKHVVDTFREIAEVISA